MHPIIFSWGGKEKGWRIPPYPTFFFCHLEGREGKDLPRFSSPWHWAQWGGGEHISRTFLPPFPPIISRNLIVVGGEMSLLPLPTTMIMLEAGFLIYPNPPTNNKLPAVCSENRGKTKMEVSRTEASKNCSVTAHPFIDNPFTIFLKIRKF